MAASSGLGERPVYWSISPPAALIIAEEIIQVPVFMRENNPLWNGVFGTQLALISMRGGTPSMVSSANCFLIEES